MRRPRLRRYRRFLLVPLALVLGYGVQVARFRPMALRGEAIEDGFSRASGVVHVHTRLSDGSGDPVDVIGAARTNELDFVFITDHENVEALAHEGYHGDTLALAGSELSTTAGHLLGLGLEQDPAFRFSGDAVDGLVDVRALGGFPVVAHPLSPREDLMWTGWDLEGPWGLEIANGDSAWRAAGPRLITTMMRYRLNPRYALLLTLPAPDASLARWDALLEERPVTAIYGADAHARVPITERWAWDFPSYEAIFSVARNHVLLDEPLSGDASADRLAILDAFRRGRLYLGLDALAPADGFAFVVRSAEGQQWTMGDDVIFEPGLRIQAGGRMPPGARVRLFRNTSLEREGENDLDAPVDEPGVYRVTVEIDGWDVPWVISNAVAILDASTLEARRAAAAWPRAGIAHEPKALLDDFDEGTIFDPAHDSESTLDEPLVDPEGGVAAGALRLSFHLGEPTPQHPDVYVAAINRKPRDFTGYDGLTFWIRGDGVYRIWLQVRDENPRSADEGTEWWFASVKTETAWRQVSVPFARLRSENPRTDGKLDLDRVRALVLVLDKGAMKPGSAGTIWLDSLGLY